MTKADTLLVQAGRAPEKHEGMVNPPVYRTSTVIFPDIDAYEARKSRGFKTVRYGRHGTPTTFAFEEAVAQLEGGFQATAMPNGLAAIAAVLCALVRPGAHLLVTDTVYAPARNFCEKRLRSMGVEVEYYDPLIGGRIKDLIKPNTVAVYCESPGSLTFEVQDIPAIAAVAHAHGVLVIADNTWATPYFFAAFEHGVDVSIHAATKYICGHSDVMMGVIVANQKCWDVIREAVSDFGYGVGPDDCYLALRGLRTLGVRLRQQMENALYVSSWLESRPEVSRVLYPALPGDPGNAIWRRDFKGAASLFTFVLRPTGEAAVKTFVNALRLFGIGSSWGGYESLVSVVHAERHRTVTAWSPGGPAIRLHIGLEDPRDLTGDLQQAFAAASGCGE